MTRDQIIHLISSKDIHFDEKALALYHYQRANNVIYSRFLKLIHRDRKLIDIGDIPFLPIGLFKNLMIKTGQWPSSKLFYSSGTSTSVRSVHHIRDEPWYHSNCTHIWNNHFCPLGEYTFLTLLPNYRENPSSSLLSMVDYFISKSGQEQPKSYLSDYELLFQTLDILKDRNRKVVLFGVSFALLDYAEKYSHDGLRNMIIIETGGMKKFRREMTRYELHEKLRSCFGDASICSEYGMTECLSQLYSVDSTSFIQHDRMQILISDINDPLRWLDYGEKGRINIIDLANIDTMSFISTDDIGSVKRSDDTLEIYGRLDNSDLRGCNYLVG